MNEGNDVEAHFVRLKAKFLDRCREHLDATLGELAAAERVSPNYISRLLKLSLYAPIIIEAALDGTLSHETVARFGKDEPAQLWRDQMLPAQRCDIAGLESRRSGDASEGRYYNLRYAFSELNDFR